MKCKSSAMCDSSAIDSVHASYTRSSHVGLKCIWACWGLFPTSRLLGARPALLKTAFKYVCAYSIGDWSWFRNCDCIYQTTLVSLGHLYTYRCQSTCLPGGSFHLKEEQWWCSSDIWRLSDGLYHGHTWRVLKNLSSILAPNGIAYILFCARNKPKEVCLYMRSQGWLAEEVITRKAGWEVLTVVRFEKDENHQK